jgi:anti-sigma-K factor RskA
LNIQEYISSGILELYVLGQLSNEESKEVEVMMEKHVLVKQEVVEISNSLEKYSKLTAIEAPAGIKSKLFQDLPSKVNNNNTTKPISNSNNFWNPLSGFLLALSMVGFTLYYISHQANTSLKNDYQKQLLACDSLQTVSQKNYAILEEIKSSDNHIFKLDATENFGVTEIYLHKNDNKKQNLLQLTNLPIITAEQSFQLWSLKEGQAPIPLTVFNSGDEIFIPVDYEEDTPTYAITIEPAGGSLSPDLNNLIGTIKVI